ncbi:haloacid dehalogenase type II [Salinigranum salinum]|uniref:haloacid dehalogenase type II n=1 Tax=Salinigranum salinum TaxID=1364937 RepID=UPI0012605B88|nr:haloacid dehalogenase type II [Salinigranum salinum]
MPQTFDADRVEAVLFDSYGTLVDTRSAARVLDGIVDDPDVVATAWRENALFYSVVANDLDQYDTYFELHLDGLRDALGAEGVELPEDRLRDLNGVYHDLEPFGDVARGFERLAAAGYRPSICSNGNPEMLDSLVASTGIADIVAERVSAHDVRTLKPARELYEHAASRVGREPRQVAHVTAHWMDVQGAMNAGMQGVHLRRDGAPAWPSFGPAPTLAVDSLDALCDRLGV